MAEAQERFSRIASLMGDAAMERLAGARVAVAGLGGVGSNALVALVRGGVGAFALADCDRVESSNINRQAIAFEQTVGMRKVDAAAVLAAAINPHAAVEACDLRLDAQSTPCWLDGVRAQGPVDYIVDAVDSVTAKLALALYAQEAGIPIISCMGTANKLDATALRFADLFQTANDPLCRAMRREARKRGIRSLPVLYSTETARQTTDGMLGTTSYLAPVAGMLLAQRVVCGIAGLD